MNASPIYFTLNKRKALDALAWIVKRGERNLYNAMKILFAADKYHLNTYGRPIAGDRYVAMDYGTVPYWTYNAAKRGEGGLRIDKTTLSLARGRKIDGGIFSESDFEALEHGFAEYAGKDFNAVRDKNHEEYAWRMAYARRAVGQRMSNILFEDMIEGKPWLVKDLQETGHLSVL